MPDPTTLTSDELLALVQDARWFGAKDKTPEGAEIVDVPVRDPVVTLAMAEVRFGTGTHEHYLLDFGADGSADVLERPEVAARLAELSGLETPGAVVESLNDFPSRRENGAFRIALGSLYSGQTMAAVVRVTLPEGEAGKARDVVVRVQDLDKVLGERALTARFVWASEADNQRQRD